MNFIGCLCDDVLVWVLDYDKKSLALEVLFDNFQRESFCFYLTFHQLRIF